jgi:hypothetical protein
VTHPSRRRPAALVAALLALPPAPLAADPEPPTEPPTTPAPLFVDVTDAAGIDFRHRSGATGRKYLPETMGAGGCVLDADGDRRLDLYLVQSGPLPAAGGPAAGGPRPTNRLYRNLGTVDGRPAFEDVTDGSGAGDRSYGQGAVCGDVDGDGDDDIYLTNFGANVLLRNDGEDGRIAFTDVTVEAGVGDPRWSSSAVLFDPDRDGDLDLYVVDYLDFTLESHRDCRHLQAGALLYCHPDVYPPAADVFYRNLGVDADGRLRFADATTAAGLTDRGGKGLGAVAADLDGDGWSDLYVTNDSTPNFLYRNLGDGGGKEGAPRFEEVGLFLGAAYNAQGKTEAGMGVDAGDVHGDGDLDLFVTNLSLETNALYLRGDAGFVHATRDAGLHAPSFKVLGFGTHLADVDADGDLDLVVINGDLHDNVELLNDALRQEQRGQVFLNDTVPNGRVGHFTAMPASAVGDPATPRVGRGSILADFDDDGRLDLVVSYNDDRARLYQNRAEPRGWIGFRLEGAGANTRAVGARVTVEAGGRRQLRELRIGSSYQTSSDPRLHFGLGDADRAQKVTIRWPDGRVQTLEDLPAGRYHTVRQEP